MTEPTPHAPEPRAESAEDGPRHRFRSPLIWFSGADPEVLELSPGDRARYTGLGSAVLFTASIAGLSMCIAMRMALGIPIAVALPIAIGWFLGIAGLDRWLVSSMEKTAPTADSDADGWGPSAPSHRPFWFAVPRLVLALIFGAVISTPITLLIFNAEIQPAIGKIHQRELNEHLKVAQNGSAGTQIRALQGQKAALEKIINSGGLEGDPAVTDPDVARYNAQLKDLDAARTKEEKLAGCEEEGDNGTGCEGTTGRPNCGRRCRAHAAAAGRYATQFDEVEKQRDALVSRLQRQNAGSAQQRVSQAKEDLTKVQQQLARLQRSQSTIDREWQKDNEANNGLLIRMEALEEATKGHSTLKISRFVLFLFFTVIECLPVIVKLMMPDSAYEDLARERKKQDKLRGKKKLRLRRDSDAREDEAYYTETLHEARMSLIDEIIDETRTLELDIARRRLHDWHRRQSQNLPPAAPPPGYGHTLPGAVQPPPPYDGQTDDLSPAPPAIPPTPPQQPGHSPDTIRLPPPGHAADPSAAPAPGSAQPAPPADHTKQAHQPPAGPPPPPSGTPYPAPPSPARRAPGGQGVGGLPHIGVVPSGADPAEPSTGRFRVGRRSGHGHGDTGPQDRAAPRSRGPGWRQRRPNSER